MKFNPATLLPQSSQDAMQVFDERYNALRLLAEPATWVSELGEEHATPALRTRYPMSLLALKYLESLGDETTFRRIGEKDVDLTVAEYKDGVEIELVKLVTNSFSAARWYDAPAAMLQAEQIFKTRLIAAALEANTATCGWDGLALFHASHLSDFRDTNSPTFGNLQTTPKDVVDVGNIADEITAGADVLDENGDPLGVSYDTVCVPRQKFQKLAHLLKQDLIATPAGTATMRNPYSDGSLSVVPMNQLTDADDWYLADSKLIAKGVVPWTVGKLAIQAPGFDALGLRRYDPDNSDYARQKGVVAVSSHIFYGSTFLFPHAFRKVAGA